jgi:hypothetical protein
MKYVCSWVLGTSFFNVVGQLSRTSHKVHIQFQTVIELRITELTETSINMLSTKWTKLYHEQPSLTTHMTDEDLRGTESSWLKWWTLIVVDRRSSVLEAFVP